MELLQLISSFLLAVHPPTNTYVCHTPASFYFSLHTGEEAEGLMLIKKQLVNILIELILFVRWEAAPGESAVHYVPETSQQRREVHLQLCGVPLANRLH